MSGTWQDTQVSACGTFHVLNGRPLYSPRYCQVMKYHAPGLAPVKNDSSAFHIDSQGCPAYPNRFVEAFGFYEDLAAVGNEEGYFHITPQGKAAYPERYQWCGNFQDGFCPVRAKNGLYFHINRQGQRSYQEQYQYVGDFKENVAVVCNEFGLHTHISQQGTFIHNQWFLDLDVFHKGFARARDSSGWFHLDKSGKPIYKERYATVEPFYNGIARVERLDGGIITINQQGKKITDIRQALVKPGQQLSADMVGFWRTETIATAVRLKMFDFFPETTSNMALKLKLPAGQLERLLRALWELGLIEPQGDTWQLTEKGALLKPQEQKFLAAAAIMWSDVNTGNWKNLPDYIRSNPKEGRPLFKATASDDKLGLYHQAIDGYAAGDISLSTLPINWQVHRKVLGVGRTAKVLLEELLQNNLHQAGILLGEEYVLKHLDLKPNITSRYQLKCHDILQPWSEMADAILLPKVLHYWPDQAVLKILRNACQALLPNGTLYLFEMILDKNSPNGSLLDLNMLAETGGKLRFLAEWQNLLDTSQLALKQNLVITPWLNLLVVKPRLNGLSS